MFVVATVFSLTGAAAGQAVPYLTGLLLDALVDKAEFSYCAELLLAVALFSLVQILFAFLQRNM